MPKKSTATTKPTTRPPAATSSPIQAARLTLAKADEELSDFIAKCDLILEEGRKEQADARAAFDPFRSEDAPLEGITREHWKAALLTLRRILTTTGMKPTFSQRSWIGNEERTLMDAVNAIVEGDDIGLEGALDDIELDALYIRAGLRRLIGEALDTAERAQPHWHILIRKHLAKYSREQADRLEVEADQRDRLQNASPEFWETVRRSLPSKPVTTSNTVATPTAATIQAPIATPKRSGRKSKAESNPMIAKLEAAVESLYAPHRGGEPRNGLYAEIKDKLPDDLRRIARGKDSVAHVVDRLNKRRNRPKNPPTN